MLGKLIVATSDEEIPGPEDRWRRASRVDNLGIAQRGAGAAAEPELRCVAALLSPSTGIIDSHA
jgi:L-2-hydroxyglutarate oxidase LhgO